MAVLGTAVGVVATILLRSQFFGLGTVEWSVLIPVAAALLAVCLPTFLPGPRSKSIRWKPASQRAES